MWFDGSGWCLLSKRLENGSFQLPAITGEAAQVQIDGTAFAALLAGIDFTAARLVSPPTRDGADGDRQHAPDVIW